MSQGKKQGNSEEASIVTQEEKTVEVRTAVESWVWSETQQPPLTTEGVWKDRWGVQRVTTPLPIYSIPLLGLFPELLIKTIVQ